MCAEGEKDAASGWSELSMSEVRKEAEKRMERLRKSEKRRECFGFLSLLDRVLVRRSKLMVIDRTSWTRRRAKRRVRTTITITSTKFCRN